jgi:DNA-binding HxlR family transcriptional regulator
MESDGLVDRKVYPVVPPMVEYSLTPLGKRFLEPMAMLEDWARQNDDAVQRLKRRRKKRDKAEA